MVSLNPGAWTKFPALGEEGIGRIFASGEQCLTSPCASRMAHALLASYHHQPVGRQESPEERPGSMLLGIFTALLCRIQWCLRLTVPSLGPVQRGRKHPVLFAAYLKAWGLNLIWGDQESDFLPLPSWEEKMKRFPLVSLPRPCMKVKALVTQLCLTLSDPMDVAQAPLSMGFSRQEYWSGLPFPTPGRLCVP